MFDDETTEPEDIAVLDYTKNAGFPLPDLSPEMLAKNEVVDPFVMYDVVLDDSSTDNEKEVQGLALQKKLKNFGKDFNLAAAVFS